MLDNFRKNIVDPLLGRSHHHHHEVDEDDIDSQTPQTESGDHDGSHVRPDIKSHWLSAMADTIQVPGCHCVWCMRHDNSAGEVKREHLRVRPQGPSMAMRSEVMEVLYTPSYLGISQTLDPEDTPPAYESRPMMPSNAPKVQSPCIFSREGRELDSLVPGSPRRTPYTPRGLLTPPTVSVSSYNLFDADTPCLDFAVPSAHSPPSRSRPQLPITGVDLGSPECDRDQLPSYSLFDSSRPPFPRAFDMLGPYPPISIPFPNLR